jgi:hypothetical protein
VAALAEALRVGQCSQLRALGIAGNEGGGGGRRAAGATALGEALRVG